MEKNWLEWVVFGISLALVLGLLAYIGYDAITLGERPPLLDVRIDSTFPGGGGWMVPVTVVNRGDMTAGQVDVRVELQRGGTAYEEASLGLDFIPRGGTRRGWVTFRSDPEEAEKVVGYAVGYKEP